MAFLNTKFIEIAIVLCVVLAVTVVTCAFGNPLVDKFETDLQNTNYRVRWDALEGAGKLGPEAKPFVPVLLEHLKKKNDVMTTVQTLGRIGTAAEAALPSLCLLLETALKDPSPYNENASLRPIILIAIAQIKQTPETTAVLRKALKHPVSTVRYEAAHVLGQGGQAAKAAIPDLQALKDDHEFVGLYVYPYGNDVAESAALALKNLER